MAKFLTSARAVDMLGRQQIAGIPTAVSEIFKNAYDAYARTVRGDFYPDSRLMALRDDGIGMSRDDFNHRWLTIGTDSKARDSASERPKRPPSMPERRQMGEKGIGRLAIATVGPQLLLVSKALNGPDEYVVALVQWTFFQVPGLTLDDVVIPVRYIQDLNTLDAVTVAEMRDEVSAALEALRSRVPTRLSEQIARELEALEVDVLPILRVTGPNLFVAPGTAFIVSAVSDDVDSAMQRDPSKSEDVAVSPFQRFLLGFNNTMIDRQSPPEMTTEFIVHDTVGVRDLIDPAEFWSPDDFKMTDHVIEGAFDLDGKFAGSVSIYGAEPIAFVEPWRTGRGATPVCGGFSIKFGYVQGEQSGSRLTGEQFALMTARLERLGGLYVYRDDIRVLPYGNSDKDYLEIEQRRSLNAGRYYFSYRRMFGAIELDSEANPLLQEKAGREGFRENQAYRDFTSILQNFLVQMAATFFSSKSAEGEEWKSTRERLKDRSSKRAEREAKEKRRRLDFVALVDELLDQLESGAVSLNLQRIVSEAERAVSRAVDLGSPGDLDSAERMALEALDEIRRRFDVVRPVSLALGVDEERTWATFERRVGLFRREADESADRVAAAIEGGESRVNDDSFDHPSRRRARLEKRGAEIREDLDGVSTSVGFDATQLGTQVQAELSRELDQFEAARAEVLSGPLALSASQEIEGLDALDQAARSSIGRLEAIRARIARATDEDAQELLEMNEELLDLRAQVEENLEVLQLGQAVQLVSHEFESNIRGIRRGLQELAPWAKSTPRLAPTVRDLTASFTHLDAYLRLFTPLQRRLYRQATDFSGDDIFGFVNRVFSERLEREGVSLDATPNFRRTTLVGYPSTFYPAFLNLVDNAIHWAGSVGIADPRIELDAGDQWLSISDNGPGIRPRDAEAIFERGFSRRRGGRGLGLSLARDLLRSDGWILELDTNFDTGARFTLTRQSEGSDE